MNSVIFVAALHSSIRSSSVFLLFTPIINCGSKATAKPAEPYYANDNLQAMLATMYDYWFVQFDYPDENGKPYRSSGGKMVWNERLKREIAAEWHAVQLKELLKKNSRSFTGDSTQPTIDLSVMPSGSISLSRLNTSDEFTTNLYGMQEGDLLFGGIRPYLRKAGIAPCDGAVTGTVRSFSVIREPDFNFAALTMASQTMFDYAMQVSTGTRMPTVTADALLNRWVPYNEEVAARFGEFSLKGTVVSNVKEALVLQELRDWLLPMLMNGQATVRPQQANYRLSDD